MDLTPRPLAFAAGQLNGLSERLIASHHANNYSGAVKRLNAIRAPARGARLRRARRASSSTA